MEYYTPPGVRPPFGNYVHGVGIPAGARLLVTSGQLGISVDDTVPPDVTSQARICFENIRLVLKEGGMTMNDIVRLNAFVTRREDFADYMAVRDDFVGSPPPASTLVIVSGFTRAEFLVEIEALAARVD